MTVSLPLARFAVNPLSFVRLLRFHRDVIFHALLHRDVHDVQDAEEDLLALALLDVQAEIFLAAYQDFIVLRVCGKL